MPVSTTAPKLTKAQYEAALGRALSDAEYNKLTGAVAPVQSRVAGTEAGTIPVPSKPVKETPEQPKMVQGAYNTSPVPAVMGNPGGMVGGKTTLEDSGVPHPEILPDGSERVANDDGSYTITPAKTPGQDEYASVLKWSRGKWGL